MFHVLPEHHLVKYLASSFPNEAVQPVSIQRRSGGDTSRTTRPFLVSVHAVEGCLEVALLY
jgi:hypothetical protein